MFTAQDYVPGATNNHVQIDNTEHLYDLNWYPDSLNSPGNALQTDPNGNQSATSSSSFDIWDSRQTDCLA